MFSFLSTSVARSFCVDWNTQRFFMHFSCRLITKSPPNSGGHEMLRRNFLGFGVEKQAHGSFYLCQPVSLPAQIAADMLAGGLNEPIAHEAYFASELMAFFRNRMSPLKSCSNTHFGSDSVRQPGTRAPESGARVAVFTLVLSTKVVCWIHHTSGKNCRKPRCLFWWWALRDLPLRSALGYVIEISADVAEF